MKLTADGIAAGWQVEEMPGGRLMIDILLMPDGNVLLINGAATGVSAFSIFDIRHLIFNMLRHISWARSTLFPIRSAHRTLTTQVYPFRIFVDIC